MIRRLTIALACVTASIAAAVTSVGPAQAAPRPLAPTDLLNAPIPAYCMHAAGRLVNGNLPLKNSGDGDRGYATVRDPSNTKRLIGPPATPDLTGDGVADLAGVLACSGGGVSWPDMILAYKATSHGPALLAGLSLGNVTPAEHATATSLSIKGRDIAARWTTTEGCCFYTKTWSATFHWKGKKLVVQHLRQTSGPVGAPLGDPSNHIGPDGLGAIRIGMTTTAVDALSDPALEFEPPGGGLCNSFTADGILILLPDGPVRHVEWIEVDAGGVYSDVSTSKRIHIGSTVAQVRARYPGGRTGNSEEMGPYYAIFSRRNVLAFGIKGGKVTHLVAATKQTFALDEICA